MSGLPLFGVSTGLGMSPLCARCRAAETSVPEVCFRHLRWIGERRSSSSLVRMRVLRGATRVALHPSGCSTQPGVVNLDRLHQPRLRERFLRNGLHPEVCYSTLLSVMVIRLARSCVMGNSNEEKFVFSL